MTRTKILRESLISCLPKSGRQLWRLFLSKILGNSPDTYFLDPLPDLSSEQLQKLSLWIDQAIEGTPWPRIIKEREFWSLWFHINEATLDPRPDTETLIEAVLKSFPDKNAPINFCDLGTGSGCILVSLLSEYRRSHGTGVDLNPECVLVAQRNAARHNVAERCLFVQGSWLRPIDSHIDILVSNPPYIPTAHLQDLSPSVINYDPMLALGGGAEGFSAYQDIADQLKIHSNPPSNLFFEIGVQQEKGVSEIYDKIGYTLKATFHDLQGICRVLHFEAKN